RKNAIAIVRVAVTSRFCIYCKSLGQKVTLFLGNHRMGTPQSIPLCPSRKEIGQWISVTIPVVSKTGSIFVSVTVLIPMTSVET
ncbi:hypothetical protein PIB30_115988, partial [Stylosanthes scabra]|nr:hypothetical protein [Stylosanthes scabra]